MSTLSGEPVRPGERRRKRRTEEARIRSVATRIAKRHWDPFEDAGYHELASEIENAIAAFAHRATMSERRRARRAR